MTRFMLLAAVLAAALAATSQAVRAEGTARWCSVTSTTGGNVREDCNWNTIQECQARIAGGERGFCNENPNYKASNDAPKKTRKPR